MVKQYIIVCSLLALLICSAIPVTASTSGPVVRLPTDYVTMRAEYGEESWFDMTLLGIEPGYDVTNGQYLGWCVQKDTSMTRSVNHTVLLYSSYDPGMPVHFRNDNWDKVNYMLNHKQGGRETIQNVIWYYICDDPYPTNDTLAQAMINDANANASNGSFVPQPGQKIAILVDVINGIYSIQRTFFELTLPSAVTLGDLVWNDWDADGIQDAGEPGLSNVTVQLLNESNATVTTTTTDTHGYYSFSNFTNGSYSIQFVLPPEYRFSPAHQGTDDINDSDADPLTGKTALTVFNPADFNMNWDAGMYVPVEPDTPGGPGTPVPPETPNHPPTADGTAGEPYQGITHAEITFDGSRSYDRDGRIIYWRWSFGDGTKGTGETVKHSYALSGNYTVVLTVTDNLFASDNYSTTATILLGNNPPATPTLSGPTSGHMNVSYLYTVVSTDPDGDSLQYIFDWSDGSQSTSPPSPSGHSIQPMHQWNATGFYWVRVYARDPSNATSEPSEMRVAIDVLYVENLGYLINVDGVGPFDLFYSNKTGKLTRVQFEQNGVYSIDSNGSGTFNYQYDVQSGVLSKYPERLELQYTMLLVGMGIVILFIVLISFFGRRKKGKT